MPFVTVYSKSQCVQCTTTKRILQTMGVEYDEVRIDLGTEESDQALSVVKALGYKQAPVVVTEDGRHWSGLDPVKLQSLAG